MTDPRSMEFITVIEYLSAALLGFYLLGLLIVWSFEFRKNALYQKMQKRLREIEEMGFSAALGYAKTYKIKHDFRREIESLERMQKFILVQVLFIAKGPNKTGKGWL